MQDDDGSKSGTARMVAAASPYTVTTRVAIGKI